MKWKSAVVGTLCAVISTIAPCVRAQDPVDPYVFATSQELVQGDREVIEYLRGACSDGLEHVVLFLHDKGCVEDITMISGEDSVEGDVENFDSYIDGSQRIITFAHCHNIFPMDVVLGDGVESHPLEDPDVLYGRRFYSRVPSPLMFSEDGEGIKGDIPTMLSSVASINALNDYAMARNLIVIFDEYGRTQVISYGLVQDKQFPLVDSIHESVEASLKLNQAYASGLRGDGLRMFLDDFVASTNKHMQVLVFLSDIYTRHFNKYINMHCQLASARGCEEPSLQSFIEHINAQGVFYIHDLGFVD